MSRYALLDGNIVVNVVVWDGVAECPPLEGAVELPSDSPVCVGYTFDGEDYVPPQPPDPPVVI